MRSLKALISKSTINRAHPGEYHGKYLNFNYFYICIPIAIDIIDYFTDWIGDEADDECSIQYWVINFEDLGNAIRSINLSYEDEFYVYAIEKRICMRYKIEELTNLIDDWDHNEVEFCGWPRIDIDELLKLK